MQTGDNSMSRCTKVRSRQWAQGLSTRLAALGIATNLVACGGGLVAPELDTTVDSAVRPPAAPMHIETFSAETHHCFYFGYFPDGTCLTG